MGADLFEDKFDGAVWALDHLPADPLPPPGPDRAGMDADLHRVLAALVEHGHDGPFRVLGAQECALMVLRRDWSWLRTHAVNLGLDGGASTAHGEGPVGAGASASAGAAGAPGTAGSSGDSDGPHAPDVSEPSHASDVSDVSRAAGLADVFDRSEGSGRADPADVTDPVDTTDPTGPADRAVRPAGTGRVDGADGADSSDGAGSLDRTDLGDDADHIDGPDRTDRVDNTDRSDSTERPSPFPPGRPPVVETEADLERALAALDSQGFPDRAFALCREGGRKALAAVLSARAYDRPAAWLAEHAPKKVLRGLLSEVVMAVQQVRLTERVPDRHVNSGFLPDIGEVRSRRRPRSVSGDKALTLPVSVRRVVRGEHATRVESEVVLPKAEHSRTLEGPSEADEDVHVLEGSRGSSPDGALGGSPDGFSHGSSDGYPYGSTEPSPGSDGDGEAPSEPAPGGAGAEEVPEESFSGSMFGPTSGPHTGNVHSLGPHRGGVPGQLATIRWDGFSRAWDDLGNRYVMLFEVEKGRPGLSSFLGTEVITQTLFPALAEDARQLMLVNPGHLVTRAPTIDGQVSGRPSVRTVPDGNVVTVRLRRR